MAGGGNKVGFFFGTAVGFLTYVTTCWTLLLAALFLMYPLNSDVAEKSQFVQAILVDLSLMAAFALQHSVLASDIVKAVFERCGFQAIQRAVYVASTSAVLQLLMRLWEPVSTWYLWNFTTTPYVQSVVIGLHVLAWFSMACSCLALDYPELLGMKQIYYSQRQLETPVEYKSATVRRLYRHCRHPVFLPLVLLLWATPFMSLDRLCLAVSLPLYLVARSNMDWEDAAYVQEQYLRKHMKLHCQ